ncbi:MAG: hemin ABC transporter substrate-binding protein [Myxococcota bacterium]
MRIFLTISVFFMGLTDAHAEERVVTLGSSVTEIVYALGLGDQVVGTDVTSLYPAAAAKKRTLGHFRGLSSEGVLSLRPTLVVAVDGVGPPEAVAAVKRLGVTWISVPNGHTRAELKEKFTKVGRAFGKVAEAEALYAEVADALDSSLSAAPKEKQKVLFIYARGRGAMNVAGKDTGADTIITWAGGTNAVQGYEGYKPLTAEAVVRSKADVILVTTRGLESLGGVDGLMKAPGVALTPAGKKRRIIAVDDLKLLGFGPRVGEGVRELAQALRGAAPM